MSRFCRQPHQTHPSNNKQLYKMVSKADQNDPVKQSIEATKAEYVRLGKSGLRVSIPILGAMSIGHKDWYEHIAAHAFSGRKFESWY